MEDDEGHTLKDNRFTNSKTSGKMLCCRKSQGNVIPLCFSLVLSYLAANVNRDTDDHGRNSNASNEGDAYWSADQGPQLPQNLLFPAPRLLPPERAAGRTDGGKRRESHGCAWGGKNLQTFC